MFLTMVAGWLIPQLSPWVWTRFILTTISIPALVSFLVGLNPRLGGISKRSHIRNVLSDLYIGLAQIGVTITMLAFQAWLMTDAILRTLGRLWFTHRKMLEWTTAAQAGRRADLKLAGIYRRMMPSVLIAIAVLFSVVLLRRGALSAAIPFALLWMAAPAVARWISLPPKLPELEPLVAADARRVPSGKSRGATWRYFRNIRNARKRKFSAAGQLSGRTQSLWLRIGRRRRISGLYLLAAFSRAWYLGWCGATEGCRSEVKKRRSRTLAKTWKASAATSTTGTTRGGPAPARSQICFHRR